MGEVSMWSPYTRQLAQLKKMPTKTPPSSQPQPKIENQWREGVDMESDASF